MLAKLAALSMKKAVIAGVLTVALPSSLLLIAPGLRAALFGTTAVAGTQEIQSPAADPAPPAPQSSLRTADSSPVGAKPKDSPSASPTPFEPTSGATSGSSTAKPAGGNAGGGGGNTGGGAVQNGTFEIKGNVDGLYPGAQLLLELKLENASTNAIRITRLQVVAANSDRTGCDSSNLVTPAFTDNSSTDADDIVVPRNGETFTTLAVGMVGNPSDSCQNASWNLTYTGQAVKA